MFVHLVAFRQARTFTWLCLGLILLLVQPAAAACTPAAAPAASDLAAHALLDTRVLSPIAPAAQASPTPGTGIQRYFLPSLLQLIPDTDTYLADLAGPVQIHAAESVTAPSQGSAHEVASPAPKSEADDGVSAALPSGSQITSGGDICANVVQRDGEQLVLGGKPFSFVGVNVSYLLEDYFPEQEIPKIMALLADSGVTAVRIWVFPNHDLDRAERILDLGRRYNIRFVVSLINYYFDKGAWWFDPQYYEKDYLAHVRKVVTRFRGRPEVLMWELMNEPNCSTDTTGSCAGNMVRWATAVSQEIKKIDPCHLTTTGAARADPVEAYRDLHAIPTIDVVSIHKNADLWLEQEIQVAHELNKPVLIGEAYARAYGKSCDPIKDGIFEERAKVVAGDMERAWSEGVDGYLLWQYGAGRIEVGDDVQHYCNGYDYLAGDPIWSLLASEPVSHVSLGPS